MAFVIGDDCVMCGTCAANCPAEAISEGNGKYVINADSCMECGTCAANCQWARSLSTNSTGTTEADEAICSRHIASSISDDFRGRERMPYPLRTI